MRVVLLPAARRDLVALLDYLTRQSGSERIGRRMVDRIRAHYKKIGSLPGTLGRDRSDLEPQLRSTVCGIYVIFFRDRSDRMEIVKVVEGHRDMKALFGQEAMAEASLGDPYCTNTLTLAALPTASITVSVA